MGRQWMNECMNLQYFKWELLATCQTLFSSRWQVSNQNINILWWGWAIGGICTYAARRQLTCTPMETWMLPQIVHNTSHWKAIIHDHAWWSSTVHMKGRRGHVKVWTLWWRARRAPLPNQQQKVKEEWAVTSLLFMSQLSLKQEMAHVKLCSFFLHISPFQRGKKISWRHVCTSGHTDGPHLQLELDR